VYLYTITAVDSNPVIDWASEDFFPKIE
jgi:hypothetical protein